MAATAGHAAVGGRPAPPATGWAIGHRLRPGPGALALLTGAIVWEISARALRFAFLPPLSTVLQSSWHLTVSGEIPDGLSDSIGALAAGYGAAVVTGVPLGLLLGRSRLLADVLGPYFDALLAVPSVLLVPIFFGMFGLSRMTEVSVVYLYSLVVIVHMTRGGLATLDPMYVEMARVFGASERQILRCVLLPGALPMVMAGLRLGMGRAVRGMINGEMLIGPVGLGALLRRYGDRFDAASVFGILVVVVALAVGASQVVRVADERLNRWSR